MPPTASRPNSTRPGTSSLKAANAIVSYSNVGDDNTKVNDAAMTLEEERHRLLNRLRLIENDKKVKYENSTTESKENTLLIRQLRQENKEMKASLSTANNNGGNLTLSEIQQIDSNIFTTTLKLDKVKDKNADLKNKITEQEKLIKELRGNLKPVMKENSETRRIIKVLENRLDKSIIKYNEAISIKRTYEQIVKRLKEEQIGFDNQLAAIERTLEAKAQDYQELLNMSHQANMAKESVMKELKDFQQAYAEERIAKDEQLANKKAYVQGKTDQTFKLERRERQLKQSEAESVRQQLEEEQRTLMAQQKDMQSSCLSSRGALESAERISQYESAFKVINEATGVTDMNDLLHKYTSQEETRRHLEQSVKENQARVDQLQTEIDDLSIKLNNLRYSGSGHLGSRRILEEFQVHLSVAERQTIANGEKYENTIKLLISSKAGIEHLVDLLSTYQEDVVPPAVDDETAVDVLKVVEQKLMDLLEDVRSIEDAEGDNGSSSAAMAIGFGSPNRVTGSEQGDYQLHSELPANNLRVHLNSRKTVDGEDVDGFNSTIDIDDPGDDAVLKREQVKSISFNAIQRETKKLKRHRR